VKSWKQFMLNPQINLRNRGLGILGLIVLVVVTAIVGKKFGSTAVFIFWAVLFGILTLFILYWAIKIIAIIIKAWKEAKAEK
jgi:uncharacterized YccA/Bax inhibitor family protein